MWPQLHVLPKRAVSSGWEGRESPKEPTEGPIMSPKKLVIKILRQKRGKALMRAVATPSAALGAPRCTSINMAF